MVVEAVDRIFGLPVRKVALKTGQPVILEESDLMCQGTEAGYPVLSVTALNPDQVKVMEYSASEGKQQRLTREQITQANLEFAQNFPFLRGIFGISRRVEWRRSENELMRRGPHR